MGCGTITIKYLLFLFNLVFCLGGLALIILGVIIQVDLKKYESMVGGSLSVPSIIVIVMGCAIFFISFLGCCGAIRESHCMLTSFAVIVFVLFLMLVALGAMMFILKGKFNEYVDKELNNVLHGNTTNDASSKDATLKIIRNQIKLQTIPTSCLCKSGEKHCSGGFIFNERCTHVIKSAASTILNVLGGVALGIGATQLVGVIFACTLASYITKKKHDK